MSEAQISNNPAGRLHDLIVRARALPSGQHSTVGDRFSLLFTGLTGPDDIFGIMQRLQVIFQLTEEIKLQLAVCDERQLALFLPSELTLKGLVNLYPLGQSWQTYRDRYLSEPVVTTLGFISITLGRQSPETLTPLSEIEELRVELLTVYESVYNANIDARLKILVLESLEVISKALAEYELRGALGINEAIGTIIGRAVLNRDFGSTTPAKDKPEDENGDTPTDWRRQFWSIITKISMAVHADSPLKELATLLRSAPDLAGIGAGEDATTERVTDLI
jgi:hypothetical protein